MVSSSIYRIDSPGGSPTAGSLSSKGNSYTHSSFKTKGKGSAGNKGISSSMKKVFRRKSSSGSQPGTSEKKEKRNSAPNMGDSKEQDL